MTDIVLQGKQALASPVALRQAIYEQLQANIVRQQQQEHGMARLSSLLLEFRRVEGWRGLAGADGVPYPNFEAFISELYHAYHLGRTQLYAYVSAAETVLPALERIVPGEATAVMDEMGISKALEIRRALKQTEGRALTPEVIDAARKPGTTTKQLRAILAEAYQLPEDERPKGVWYDFGGAYFTPEQKKTFEAAVKVAVAALGLTKETPEHVQRGEIMVAFAQEFYGTHAPDVYGPKRTQEEQKE